MAQMIEDESVGTALVSGAMPVAGAVAGAGAATATGATTPERAPLPTARFVKAVGAAGVGKTQYLAESAEALLQKGVSPDSILILVATNSAADAMRQRLGKIEVRGAESMLVCTPERYFVAMLSSAEGMRASGRVPRLLEDFEMRILLEDMKVTGVKSKRLREMLKFFYRQWSELADDADDFIETYEERLVYDSLRKHLVSRDAMMIEELSNVAYRTFVKDGNPLRKYSRDYVLADDFQNYSKATQCLLAALSKKQLVVAGNVNETVQTKEPYPYACGFDEFEQTYEGAQVIHLKTWQRQACAVASICNSLTMQPSMDTGVQAGFADECEEGQVRFVQWPLPNQEFMGLGGYIKHRLNAGAQSIHPRDIGVIVPNALWGKALCKLLSKNDIESSLMISYYALTGDPRRMEKCASLRAFTALNLVSDATDVTAWRSWCGFGDYLACSNHWCRLEEYALEQGKGVLQVLEEEAAKATGVGDGNAIAIDRRTSADASASEPAFLGADVLVAAYKRGCEMIKRCSDKAGFALLNNLLGEPLPEDFMGLLNPVAGPESARELLDRARAAVEVKFSDTDAVRVGLPSMMCGLEFDTVILAGAVDGFYPTFETFGDELDDDAKDDMRAQQRRVLYSALSKACRYVVVSCFHEDDSNTANALGMWARRIRMENDKRMAVLSPSRFVDEMGDAMPGMDSKL